MTKKSSYTEEFRRELDRRREDYRNGTARCYTPEESKARIKALLLERKNK